MAAGAHNFKIEQGATFGNFPILQPAQTTQRYVVHGVALLLGAQQCSLVADAQRPFA